MRRLRTVFMGTPDFAVPCLTRLAEISDVAGVVTQPDRPRGRGQRLTPSPVKAFAQARSLAVYQPQRVREEAFLRTLEALAPELVVVVAFGQILPQRALDVPPLGCINVHASLLPRYRGAAPMQRCLMAGETVTGVTTMFMDAGLDTGDMLLKAEVAVPPDMTLAELHDTLSDKGAALLAETLARLSDGTLVREKQEEGASCYAPMLTKETGRIDWTRPAAELHNLVRALDPRPGAYTALDGRTYKIWRTRVLPDEAAGVPGEVLRGTERGFAVAAGAGALEVLELQAPGGRRMRASEYLRGHAGLERRVFT